MAYQHQYPPMNEIRMISPVSPRISMVPAVPPSPHHPVQLVPSVHYPVQRTPSPHHPNQLRPSPHHSNQPALSPHHPNQPRPSVHHSNQPALSPHHSNQPAHSPHHPVQPIPSHHPQAQQTSSLAAVSLEEMQRLCANFSQPSPMPHVMTDPSHCFLIKPFEFHPSNIKGPQPIHKEQLYIDRVDPDHVFMPCSPANQRNGKPLWPIIKNSLYQLSKLCVENKGRFNDIKAMIEIGAGIILDVGSLHHVVNKIFTPQQRSEFLTETIVNMCDLAMNVDKICSKPPRLLRAGRPASVTMSQHQAASLLACSFFCLFPNRTVSRSRQNTTFQDPNFASLFARGSPCQLAKIQCILNYFRRISRATPPGVITFKRYGIPLEYIPDWSKSVHTLVPVHMTSSKKIEDVHQTLQVDFANQFIGGGVLRAGCVQEEIRFVICPEMLVSLLLCEVMQVNEAIHLIGCEQYSSYDGYASTLQFGGDFVDPNPRDSWGRCSSRVVAIDAFRFDNPADQYHEKFLNRELTKAFVGFFTETSSSHRSSPVTTGHWGCGVFNGDRQFKAVIQLVAAAQAQRPMIFAAYLDQKFVVEFEQIYRFFMQRQMKVKDLYYYLYTYGKSSTKLSFFQFILQTRRT